MKQKTHRNVPHGHEHAHEHSITGELLCHLPYAIFSVSLGLAVLSFLSFISLGMQPEQARSGANMLFHAFHFMHIVFAVTGALITFLRFSKNTLMGLFVAGVVGSAFCILSDAVMPYVAGRMLGVAMEFHICFVSELHNVLPFLVVGLINGLALSRHDHERQGLYSITSHFVHILVSSFASMFYLVGHGYGNWQSEMGLVFLFLIIAVLIPCTLADIVIPMSFAKIGSKKK